jgi:hypothetical protein
MINKKQILQQEQKNKSNKIFGIGMPKTGTTSLHAALKILGYKSVHYHQSFHTGMAVGLPISILLKATSISTWDSIINTTEHTYPLMDKEFLNSKFILTIRDRRLWLKSVKTHLLTKPALDKNLHSVTGVERIVTVVHVFGNALYNEDSLSLMYDNHLRNAEYYFKDREQDLLIIDICGGEGWEKLCQFLGKEVPDVPFPHKNKTSIIYG